MSKTSHTNCVGRPKGFDIDDVLTKALAVFWAKGYEGTSLTDLTQAMGINKPSLYSTFGNKEELFLKVVDLYEQRPCGYFTPALEEATGKAVITAMLNGAAKSLSDRSNPQGCMIIQSALTGSDASESVKQALIERRCNHQNALKMRLEAAQQQGDLSTKYSAESLAHYLATIIQGMTIQATNGISPAELQRIADLALSHFPGLEQD
ncbi:TetR/AcrR family transcriptional regulator [Moritella sp. Urea-trap-13]|uniref:TetR/AcrR family transcriptional regulator n=1 Tax=Moritella sp. Urea-trap-13 TaxID=2058327 RepID=UPI000C33F676|nr:TetR/AcrR family transcriptional regulator [Moritella sp. Urea-trap-13]PKH07029.1 TetR family transcriptional regulator [Moritella sp. Urea-trap-13]